MDPYDELSESYDLIYGDELDADFYLTEAKNARGPVLEVACGTGRILLRLLSNGIDASGLDMSEKMLEVLKKKAKKANLKPVLYQADMADFSIKKKFALIILPYRSFLHLKNGKDRKKALMNFHDHLQPNGRLIIHTYVPSDDEKKMTEGHHLLEKEDLSKDGRKYSIDWYLNYDKELNAGHYRIVLTFDDGLKLQFAMTIHYVDTKEMQSMLKSCGYRNVKVYCGFEYLPYKEGCREAIWIAEK